MNDIPIARAGNGPQPGAFRPQSGGSGFRVSLEEIQRAAGSAATIDPRGFIAQAQGAGAIGEGVSRAADLGQRILIEHNASVTRRRIDEMENELDAADTQLAEALANEQDTTKWSKIAQDHAQNWQKTLVDGDKTLSIDAREARRSRFATWQSKMMKDTAGAAFSQAKKMEIAGLEGDRITAMSNGEFGFANERTDQMLSRGLIGPDEAARQKAQAKGEEERYKLKQTAAGKSAAFDRVAGMIMSNPHEAQSMADAGKLKEAFPELDETDLLNVTGDIRRAVAGKESEAMETATDLISNPQTTAADLEVLATEGKLRPAMKAQIMEAHRKAAEDRAREAPLDKAELAKLAADIDAYNEPEQQADKEKGGEKYGELLTRLGRVSSQGGAEGRDAWGVLHSRLYQRHYLHERRTAAGAENDALRTAGEFIKALGDAGSFGPRTTRQKITEMDKDTYGNDVQKEKWVDVFNKDTAIRRVKHEAKIQRELKEELKKSPELSDPFKLEKWLRDKLAPVQGAGTLKMAMPEPAPAPEAGPSAEFFTPPPDLQPFADGNILLR